ncbi:hypothetical protein [Tanticharoenia sakaeratensis]|uniref:Uncharacterized protein n=1 Tax=Tanticharoenia sakaeratensis NBRC 103193 TaxID=1231623 RepID=A0A0D6MLW3_9PROT|nr:hypothetical protein [Tanticharoenia sakaeratensis]GAN54672.1 hypothetical protein Tasa_028_039 [Tanticharoenia sakaeratensis NBRC 103193]
MLLTLSALFGILNRLPRRLPMTIGILLFSLLLSFVIMAIQPASRTTTD